MKSTEERKIYIHNLVRVLAEIMLSMDRAKIPEMLINTKFNKGLLALAGLTSSGLMVYDQLVLQINKK